MAHLPDLDLIPYFFIRKKMRVPSHWIIGHYPLWVIPITLFMVCFVAKQLGAAPREMLYYLSICFCALVAHFLHDAIQKHGHQWLKPLSNKYYWIGGVVATVTHYRPMIEAQRRRKAVSFARDIEFKERVGKMKTEQVIVWSATVTVLVFFIYYYPHCDSNI